MSYFVLARKYRPQSFEDLVGQESVAKTLVNALTQGKVAHAYLFSGPRGVGKTTTARLLARALNCAKGPTSKPCGECASCREIAAGASMEDVLEIDAASNRGIDDIRDLRENVKYAPIRSRFRIYIIDEAHQITKEGFNALLKTLEEPPSHTVFMLATTESQKMPATILSRCQRFLLRPISTPLMLDRLTLIAQKEKVEIDRPALEEIAHAAGGSMRDAISLLDQVLVFAPQGADRTVVRELLGLIPREVVASFMAGLKSGDPEKVVREVMRYVEKGGDLTQLARDLQERYHLVLQVKAGLDEFPGENLEDLRKQAGAYSFEELERGIRALGRCLDEMRRSPSPQAVFQVFCLRISQPGVDMAALLRRVEALEKKLASAPVNVAESIERKKPPHSLPPSVGEGQDGGDSLKKPPSAPPPQSSPTKGGGDKLVVKPESANISQDALCSHWSSIVQEVQKDRPALGPCLEDAQARMVTGEIIELTFSTNFNMDQVRRKQGDLLKAIGDRLGKNLTLEFRVDPNAKPKPARVSSGTVQEVVDLQAAPAVVSSETFSVKGEVSAGDLPPVEDDPWVKKVLGHFSGDLETLDPDKPRK